MTTTKNTSLTRTLLGLISLLLVCTGCGKDGGGMSKTERVIPVTTQNSRRMEFRRSIRLQGTVSAKNFSMVPAQNAGVVVEFLVDEGDKVAKGDPLCEQDREKLSQALRERREGVAVARSNRKLSAAKMEQAKANLDQSKRELKRFSALVNKGVVSTQEFENVETQWQNQTALYKVAEAQCELSKAKEKQAQAALKISERKLSDSTIKAPLNGVVTHSYCEAGEMVDIGEPVFRIEDPNLLEISAFAPAHYYRSIVPTQTIANLQVNGIDLGELPIVYCSPSLDRQLRTFEIRAYLGDPPRGVVSGSLAELEILLEEHSGVGIPSAAVVKRNQEDVVFVVEAGEARKKEVQCGLETDGYTEILRGLSHPSEPLITQGQNLLNSGDAIKIVEEK